MLSSEQGGIIILISENTDQIKPYYFRCYRRPSAKKAILCET